MLASITWPHCVATARCASCAPSTPPVVTERRNAQGMITSNRRCMGDLLVGPRRPRGGAVGWAVQRAAPVETRSPGADPQGNPGFVELPPPEDRGAAGTLAAGGG